MIGVIVLIATLASAVKTVSYGIWEFRSKNTAGGIFVMVLAATVIFLSGKYLVNYWT